MKKPKTPPPNSPWPWVVAFAIVDVVALGGWMSYLDAKNEKRLREEKQKLLDRFREIER